MKGLNDQQKLAWQTLKNANEKLTRDLQEVQEARNILQMKYDEVSNEVVRFSSRLFEAEMKAWENHICTFLKKFFEKISWYPYQSYTDMKLQQMKL